MKKSFPVMLLATALFAFGGVFGTAHASESCSNPSSSRIDEAKSFYIESSIVGIKVMKRISGKGELTPAQIAELREIYAEWLNTDLLPLLRQNGILEDWIAIQFDPEVRKIYRRTANTQSVDEFREIAQDSIALMQKRYPNFLTKSNTPEGTKVMQKLYSRMIPVLNK